MATADPFSEPFGTLFGPHITVAHGSPAGYSYAGAAQPIANFAALVSKG